MKKIALSGIRKFELTETSKPRIEGSGDVLLKVQTVGVCGSDIHYFKEGKIGSQTIEFPFTIGHECSAIVEDIGVDVRRVKCGDLVAIDPCISCGECEQCRSGREHTCLNQRFLGSPGQADGCLQEYIVLPERNCYPVPRSFTPELAALVEPLSIGYYAVSFLSRMKPVRTAAVLGVGPIGQGVTLFLKGAGIGKIFATDKLDYRLEIAGGIGVSWIGNPDTQDVVADMRKANHDLFDAVFECCGKQEALDQGIEILRPGGTLFVVGIPEPDRVSFDINLLRRKEITIQNVRRQNKSFQPVIDLISAEEIEPSFMVTHRFGCGRTLEAFDTVAEYRDKVIKAVVTM